MQSCTEQYVDFRNYVVGQAEEHLSEEQFKNLITTFNSVISSKRRSSYIKSFNDLITTLEKRGHIGESNVEPFGQIINLLPNANRLNEMISNLRIQRNRSEGIEINRNRSQEQYFNHYASTAPPFYSQNNSAGSGRSGNSTISNSNGALPEAVVDRVCKDIGTHWKDLGRNLSIREGEIDDIEVKYPRNLKERAYECLKRFMKETDPYKVQQKLLYALERCGRRDLKEDVEEILNRRAY